MEGKGERRKEREDDRRKEWKVILYSWNSRYHMVARRWLSLSLFLSFYLFSSFISAARMHARFNNAGSSMRSQRIVFNIDRHSPLSHPSPFYSPCTLRRCTRSVVHRICTSERTSAIPPRFSSLRGTWETCLLTRAAYFTQTSVSRNPAVESAWLFATSSSSISRTLLCFHAFKRKLIIPARPSSNSEQIASACNGTFSQRECSVNERVHYKHVLFNCMIIS